MRCAWARPRDPAIGEPAGNAPAFFGYRPPACRVRRLLYATHERVANRTASSLSRNTQCGKQFRQTHDSQPDLAVARNPPHPGFGRVAADIGRRHQNRAATPATSSSRSQSARPSASIR